MTYKKGQYTSQGGISISRKIQNALWFTLFASLLFALFCSAEAQSGIFPNYYGPYAPNPIGQEEYCENMMDPGTYSLLWAHGPQENWDWQYLEYPLEMEPNMRYVLTYDSFGEISIDESEDSSLTGYTVLCGRNQGPDELVLSLEPSDEDGESSGLDPAKIFLE